MTPEFLDIDDVLTLHSLQITEHGGSEGLRDRGLLESAISQPMAQFDGNFLHKDLFEMAASLLISLALNHPFVDGNKRTALHAALTFLEINGCFSSRTDRRTNQSLINLTRNVASGLSAKDVVADALRKYTDT